MAVPVPSLPIAIRFGSYTAYIRARELRKNGTRVKLQERPFQILVILLERPGEVVTREELRSRLWPDGTFVDFDHSISSAIRKLRDALCDSAATPRYIETVGRRGYCFIETVEVLSSPEQPNLVWMDSPKGVAPVKVKAVSTPRLTGVLCSIGELLHHWQFLVPLTLLVAAVITGEFLFSRRPPLLTGLDTIVLADFTNTTGDPIFDSTLRQGLAIQLAQSPFLSIVPEDRMRDTLRLMGQPADVQVTPQIARDLCLRTQSVAFLVGSISSLGSQYVIGLDAVNCKTGGSLAQEQVQAARQEDVLKALGQASTKLRKELGESISRVEKFDTPIVQATTPSLVALQAYSLGRRSLDVEGDYTAAARWFQKAIELDPDFAVAYSALAVTYANLGERSLAAEKAEKAYQLRERVSEREKFYLEAHYYDTKGDLIAARQTYELWAQVYPRDDVPVFNMGNLYDALGQDEKGLEKARYIASLEPASSLSRANLVASYFVLDRLNAARAAVDEARARQVDFDSPAIRTTLYALAFLQNDHEGMAQQLVWAAGKPGVEDVMLALEAGTTAYFGRLDKARELSRKAVTSAGRAEGKDRAAGYEADAALREALFGHAKQARQRAKVALELSKEPVVEFVAGFALAVAHDTSGAMAVANDMDGRFPEHTIVKFDYLPTIRAQIALNHNDASRALELLQSAAPFELGIQGDGGFHVALYPTYVRAQADLAAGRGSVAATEFQKILNHRGVVLNEAIGPLAYLGLARAYALQGNTSKARASYQEFEALWKEADPGLPILENAKSEYAKLR